MKIWSQTWHIVLPKVAVAEPCLNGAAPRRQAALDGLRGCLALLVAVMHALDIANLRYIDTEGRAAVWAFFVLSGCVLTQAWDGRYLRFLLRRFIRLWPVHLVGLLLCGVLLGAVPTPVDLTLFPWLRSPFPPQWQLANPPAWSMCVEVAAMPFMPVIVWCGRRGLLGVIAGGGACILLAATLYPPFLNLVWFILGAGCARFSFRVPLLELKIPQWLGRVSYSLYLSHAAIMGAAAGLLGIYGPLTALPLALGLAWIVWAFVERPSIAWSRAIGASGRDALPAALSTPLALRESSLEISAGLAAEDV